MAASRSHMPLFAGASRSDALTYRAVLSASSLNAQNPLRVVSLCDIDAAYAQFEMVRLGIPEDKPVAVSQWSGLIAVNYPARAFGITRHESAPEALKKCPDLICVHVATYKEGEIEAGYHEGATPETHKVSLDPYRRESAKILKVFSNNCNVIEKASIDEAYLDFSGPVRKILLERYPELDKAVEDLPQGLDTPLPPPPAHIDWSRCGNLIPVGATSETLEEGKGKGKAEEEPAPTWQDVALSIGAELMARCRSDVKSQLGYTCSAGIAKNKVLAKLCAGWKKPDAQTVLRETAISGFLRPLKFKKIRFLGGKLGSSIAEEYDAATVGDLWTISLDDFQRKFGSEDGHWVWEIIRGVDFSEIAAKTQTKSMLSSKNFKPPLTSWDEAHHWLKIQSSELYARLTEAREATPGVWPKTLCLNHRTEHYVSRSKQLAFPYTSRFTPEYVLKFAERLANDFRDERKASSGQFPPCTNIGLQFNGLERLEAGAQGIQRFFGANDVDTPPPDRDPSERGARAFVCSRCNRAISLSSDVTTVEPADLDAALLLLRQEHDDAHFARDLMAQERQQASVRSAVPALTPRLATKRKATDATSANGKKARETGTLRGFFKPKH